MLACLGTASSGVKPPEIHDAHEDGSVWIHRNDLTAEHLAALGYDPPPDSDDPFVSRWFRFADI